MSQAGKIRILSIACIALTLALGTVIIRERYVQRLFGKVEAQKPMPPNPTNNPVYNEQISFTKIYPKEMKHEVAMLGTSLTMRVQWNELLGREGVINRGISGDLTNGILNRVDEVISRKPVICFIEGGSNDIDLNITAGEIAENLHQAALQLKANGIIPIMFAVPHVSERYPNFEAFNRKVDEVNVQLHAIANKEHFAIIDLTKNIGDGHETYNRFTARDGMHLAPAAYQLWAEAVSEQLRLNNL